MRDRKDSLLPSLNWNLLSALIALTGVILTSCATTGKFEEKVLTWEGKDSASLIKAWGEPEAKEKIHDGNQVFVYSRLRREVVAYGGSTREIASQAGQDPAAAGAAGSSSTYIKCATYFTINPSGKIIYVMFRGDECKARD